MERKADIVLSGRKRHDEERSLYLYQHKIDDSNIIFEYEFSDWGDMQCYFILHNNEIYFNRHEPELDTSNKVANYFRNWAYSNDEIRKAIEDFLVEKALLMED
jgi:hypothetical protein